MATTTEPRAIGRRNLLRYACGCAVGGAALAAAGPLVRPFVRPLAAAEIMKATMSPDEALARLKEGNERYVTGKGVAANIETEFQPGDAKLAEGQKPHSVILSCADSRVIPEFVFNKGKGALFVIRNAGNLAGLQAIASVEYGVAFTGCSLVVVMGHSGCGAVQAAAQILNEDKVLPGKAPEVVAPIGAALARVRGMPGDLIENAVAENVRANVAILSAQQPILSQAVNHGRLKILGAVYHLRTGRVQFL